MWLTKMLASKERNASPQMLRKFVVGREEREREREREKRKKHDRLKIKTYITQVCGKSSAPEVKHSRGSSSTRG